MLNAAGRVHYVERNVMGRSHGVMRARYVESLAMASMTDLNG